MSLFKLQRFYRGDGDPIDSSDALTILHEIEEIKREEYNKALDVAIALVKNDCDYESRMTGLESCLVEGLRNSKK